MLHSWGSDCITCNLDEDVVHDEGGVGEIDWYTERLLHPVLVEETDEV